MPLGAVRVCQIEEWMDKLDRATKRVDDASSALVARLRPVLDEIGKGECDSAATPKPCLVPLAQQIKDRVVQLEQIADVLEYAGRRLELP